MSVIGILCKPDNFSYVVLKGSPNKYNIECCETYALPQKAIEDKLDYARNEIKNIVERHLPTKAAFMISESIKKQPFGGNFIQIKVPIHQYHIEGVLLDELNNNKQIKTSIFDKNAKLKSTLKKKVSTDITEHPNKIIDFMKIQFKELGSGKMNDNQRGAFTVAFAIL
jgi:hypothetical protein